MRRFFIVCVIILAVFCTKLSAAGFALYEMGGAAVGMGGAFAGFAKDASVMYYNPAAIGFLDGNHVLTGVQLIQPTTKFTPAEPFPGGPKAESESQTFTPIHLYGTYRLSEKLSVGAAVFNPYGLGLKWKNPESISGRFVSYDATLEYFDFAFTAAYRFNDHLSLAAGADFVKGTVDLRRYVELFDYIQETEAGKVKLSGSSNLATSFHAALYWQGERYSLGLSYRHNILTEFDKQDADFTFFDVPAGTALKSKLKGNNALKVSTEIDLPANLSFGGAYHFTHRLTGAFSFNYVMWSSFDNLVLDFENFEEGVDKTIKEEYEDTYIIRFGLEYRLNDKVDLRGGYVFDRSPQPKESMSTLLGDSNRNDVSFGFGYRFTERFYMDMSCFFLFFQERDTLEDGEPVQFEHLDGGYQSFAQIFGVSFGYLF